MNSNESNDDTKKINSEISTKNNEKILLEKEYSKTIVTPEIVDEPIEKVEGIKTISKATENNKEENQLENNEQSRTILISDILQNEESREEKLVIEIVSKTPENNKSSVLLQEVPSISILVDKCVSPFSLESIKQDKATGPENNFSNNGKEIFNIDNKYPTPYFDGFHASILPQRHVIAYPVEYIVETDENETSRNGYIYSVLLFLAFQILVTFAFIFLCVYVRLLENWVKSNVVLIWCAFAVWSIIFLIRMFLSYTFINIPPLYYIFVILNMCSTAYLSGVYCIWPYRIGHPNSENILLVSSGFTMVFASLIILSGWFIYIDITRFSINESKECSIMTKLYFPSVVCVNLGQLIFFFWAIPGSILMIISGFLLFPAMCVSLLVRAQLLFAKGKYMDNRQSILVASDMYSLVMFIFLVPHVIYLQYFLYLKEKS